MRIGLANIRPAANRDESVHLVLEALDAARNLNADIICFPECYVPGYRVVGTTTPVDADWLKAAWDAIDQRARELGIMVVLGTEHIREDGKPMISARVTNADGTCAGFQDKVQLDPTEEPIYVAGEKRRLFQCGDVKFGIVICHEGWRYPEATRWAARRGVQIVFHPHFEIIEDPGYKPVRFGDPDNTFHEKAAMCRAAENTCYFATVNCALAGATTTSAVLDPDGKPIAHQPYGAEGVLVVEIDPTRATGLLADRFKPSGVDLTESR